MKLSWTVNAASLDKAEQQLAAGRAAGYDSFNVKIGPPQTPDYDLAARARWYGIRSGWLSLGRRQYGLRPRHGARDGTEARRRRLPALESPLPPNRIRDYQALKRQGALPILMDEGIVSPVEAAEFIALGMFDGIAMKVARCGGLWHASRIIRCLKTRGWSSSPRGLTDPELSLAASLHLLSAAAGSSDRQR